MSEKKHVFKMVGDEKNFLYEANGNKYYGMKLVGENGKEVVFNQPYSAMYRMSGEQFVYNFPENNTTIESVKYNSVVIDVVKDINNCGYQLILRDKNKEEGVTIPRGSWYLHNQDRDLLDLDDGEQLYIGDAYYDDVKIVDKYGTHVLSLISTEFALIDRNGRFSLTSREKDLPTSSDGRALSYVTVLEGYKNAYNKPLIIYRSDERGNPAIDSKTHEQKVIQGNCIQCNLSNPFWHEVNHKLEHVLLNASNLLDVISSQNDLELLTHPTDSQLQTISQHLTDTQLQTLVEHLTEHQLKTLAQDLNETKLKIIVPALNEAQLEALVKDLKPDQVKDILPHLKMEQFKALTQNLSNEQFTELAQDLAEHHLTILSKQLEGDQLKALVNGLEGDKLKDLINKLDHNKLQAIAQDLTDANRIQIIIESLTTNPEKLQAFANGMSDQQFTDLLNKLATDTLIKVIHNLPHEKVVSAIGKLENKEDQSDIVKMLKEQIEKQNEKQDKMIEMLEKLQENSDTSGSNEWTSYSPSVDTAYYSTNAGLEIASL